MRKPADTTVDLHRILAERWSPRGFDAGHVIAEAELAALLEAARWAASSANSQPWRFLVGRRGDAVHDALFETLAAGNQLWAGRASALVLVAAEVVDGRGRSRSHAAYDTGAAVAQLTAQAGALGLVVHQMGGFDADAVRRVLDLDDRIQPLVVIAVGRHDAHAPLTEELATRESADRSRAPLSELLLPVPDHLLRRSA